MNDLTQQNERNFTNNDVIAYAITFYGNDVILRIEVTLPPKHFSFYGNDVIL